MEITLTKPELLEWLKSVSSIAIVSVTLVSGASEISSNIVSPKQLYEVGSKYEWALSEGEYLVKYEKSDIEERDLDYSRLIIAFTVLVKTNHGNITGGYNKLREALGAYEVLENTSLQPFGISGYFVVVPPVVPDEIEKIKAELKEHAIMFSMPDGESYFHSGNFFTGDGIKIQT